MQPIHRPALRSRLATPDRVRGFNLIQLIIALAVVGILAVIAFPQARDAMVRSRATEGTNALVESRQKMEQYFLSNRTYVGGPCTTSLTAGGFTVSCLSAASGSVSATGYTIVAVGSGLTAGLTYVIDHRGTMRTTAVPSGWTTVPTGGHPCWVMKRQGSCG